MTFQQLRYLIAIAEAGSISEAAKRLYVSQSTLSAAVKDFESELGVRVFSRSNRGVVLTDEGVGIISHARQIVEQSDLLKERYSGLTRAQSNRLVVSTQHYAFAVEAFVRVANAYDNGRYDFSLRETRTSEIIRDVAELRSNLGIIYLDDFNEPVLTRELERCSLTFRPLFDAQVHVFVGPQHPLATRKVINPLELVDYPRYSFEQGPEDSFHYSEEPLSTLPHERNITFTDRGTLTNLLAHGRGYTLSTGVLSSEMQPGIVSIPLDTDHTMRVGYLFHRDHSQPELVQAYIRELRACVEESASVRAPRRL